jgi:uncharacterized membrane protein YebE (DUF533 family)
MQLDFFPDQELSFEHVKALVRSMLDVAETDEVHDAEMALIRGFYESCIRPGDPSLEQVATETERPPIADLFNTPELSKMFIKTLLLLAYADGVCGPAEEEKILELARELCVASDEMNALRDATKEYLLQGLAHIRNTDALKTVRRERLEAR